MLGSMMKQPLLISELICHAARYHGDAEIVSRETSGEINVTNWAVVDEQARKAADGPGRPRSVEPWPSPMPSPSVAPARC